MCTFVRKPSCLESFFIDLDECGCNMTFHYYLQLDCRPSLELLNHTMRTMLTTTHKGMNLKYQDHLWHYADRIPQACVIEVDSDDVYRLESNRLDYYKQTIALSVLHTKSNKWFLCFDFFHGAVDGRSGIQFIYDFFAVLNGKTVCESEFTTESDDLVPVKHKVMGKKLPIPCWPVHTLKSGHPCGDGTEQTTLVRTMTCTRSMAAKLANSVASCFKKGARMIIPVDIRRFDNTQKSLFGNLIVPIFVDANAKRCIDDLRSEILGYVKNRSLLSAGLNSLLFYNKIHPRFRIAILRRLIPLVMASKKFICCALVSPVGEVKSDHLISPAFSATDIFVTFVAFPFTAFSVVSVQFDDHTNTTISWNSGRVSQEVAGNLVQSISQNLHS